MLKTIKYEKPTKIQEKVIPLFLEDKNIVAKARTGSGKTASFSIPLIEKVNGHGLEAIVLTPTRELALQVFDELKSLNYKNLKIITIYGGKPKIKDLKKANIVVATPGRLLDHIKRGTINLNCVKYFIIDEADTMLDMGFIDDVEKILKSLPENKIIMLLSATMPKKILNLANKYMEYEYVETQDKPKIKQKYKLVKNHERFKELCSVMRNYKFGIIFCRTKKEVKEISKKLKEKNFKVEAIHGDLSQKQRERVIKKFKNKKVDYLVATDVVSRGIDVNNLEVVINYNVPQNVETYLHRIGRTGRMDKEGLAITLINKFEKRFIYKIMERNQNIERW
ncbi:DEAD/DEAH box helicase [Methanocaldococcus sp.]